MASLISAIHAANSVAQGYRLVRGRRRWCRVRFGRTSCRPDPGGTRVWRTAVAYDRVGQWRPYRRDGRRRVRRCSGTGRRGYRLSVYARPSETTPGHDGRSWRHCPHQTLASRRWRIWVGMDSQRWRAGGVKLGGDSMVMAQRTQWRASLSSSSNCCSRSGEAMKPNRV